MGNKASSSSSQTNAKATTIRKKNKRAMKKRIRSSLMLSMLITEKDYRDGKLLILEFEYLTKELEYLQLYLEKITEEEKDNKELKDSYALRIEKASTRLKNVIELIQDLKFKTLKRTSAVVLSEENPDPNDLSILSDIEKIFNATGIVFDDAMVAIGNATEQIPYVKPIKSGIEVSAKAVGTGIGVSANAVGKGVSTIGKAADSSFKMTANAIVDGTNKIILHPTKAALKVLSVDETVKEAMTVITKPVNNLANTEEYDEVFERVGNMILSEIDKET